MRSEELRSHLRKRPFQPLRLVLTDGRTFEVRHPELAVVGQSTVAVGLRDGAIPKLSTIDWSRSRWWMCCESSRWDRRRRLPRRAGISTIKDSEVERDQQCSGRAAAESPPGGAGDGRIRHRGDRDRAGLSDAAPALPADAPADVFSAARAMRHVEAIAREPHPLGSAAAERVLRLHPGRAEGVGLRAGDPAAARCPPEGRSRTEVRAHRGATCGTSSPGWRGSGQPGKKVLLLAAHYDSRTFAPGAGDDASGVAAILESLRA